MLWEGVAAEVVGGTVLVVGAGLVIAFRRWIGTRARSLASWRSERAITRRSAIEDFHGKQRGHPVLRRVADGVEATRPDGSRTLYIADLQRYRRAMASGQVDVSRTFLGPPPSLSRVPRSRAEREMELSRLFAERDRTHPTRDRDDDDSNGPGL